MTTALFYFSQTKLSPEHLPITLADKTTVYIRPYLLIGVDAADALFEYAKPAEGETVLNAVELDPEQP